MVVSVKNRHSDYNTVNLFAQNPIDKLVFCVIQ